MNVFVFGNPDVEIDALPIKILPALKDQFPAFDFAQKDPNEEWDVPEELVVIDTVVGIEFVHLFENLESFAQSPRITMHGFDALMNLQLLKKLGRLKQIKIIGIPPTISQEQALSGVAEILNSNSLLKNEPRS